MDKSLKNLNKGFYEMKTALLANEKIRKILYYDQPDALSQSVPAVEAVYDYITFVPITESGIVDYKKNTFISITSPKIDIDLEEHNNLYFSFYVTIISKKDVWELEGNKLRLISLADEVIDSLDAKKLSFPAKLEVIGMQQVIYDASTYGYTIKVFCSDLQKKVEF